MLPDPLHKLVQRFSRLPGVGEKTAFRFAVFLLTSPESTARELGEALLTMHERLGACERCGNVAERVETGGCVCAICRDSKRDSKLLCVVARVQDLLAIEKSSAMRGKYFVLGRLLSPLEGVGPDDLPVQKLRARVVEDGVTELIVATPLSVDGEATALFLAQELQDLPVQMSKLATGVPHGGDLEYADQITLSRAIEGRRSVRV